MVRENKLKKQVQKKVIWAFKQLAKNNKLLTEMAIAIKSFAKLSGREMQVLFKHHKRIEDNTRWLTLQEIFGEIYQEIKKEKVRLNKFEKKYKREGNREEERKFRRAILTIGINVENNIVRKLEKQIRKKYGYWKVKSDKQEARHSSQA
jgi:hypothetical protein